MSFYNAIEIVNVPVENAGLFTVTDSYGKLYFDGAEVPNTPEIHQATAYVQTRIASIFSGGKEISLVPTETGTLLVTDAGYNGNNRHVHLNAVGYYFSARLNKPNDTAIEIVIKRERAAQQAGTIINVY